MEAEAILAAIIPSWSSVILLSVYLGYLAVAGSVLPGKIVPGAVLSDGSRLHYRCNGLLLLVLFLALLETGVYMKWISPTVIADKGLELLSVTFIFSLLVSLVLYAAGLKSRSQSSSFRPHVTGAFIHDWWFGVQLNPHFLGIDLKLATSITLLNCSTDSNKARIAYFLVLSILVTKLAEQEAFLNGCFYFNLLLCALIFLGYFRFFFVRAGMMGWLLINLSLLAKSHEAGTANISVILYQLFCLLYVLDYFFYEEFMTSTWDIIAERLGFMLIFGDLVFIPFTFSIQGWWLLKNKVELTKAAVVANCLVFLIGYRVFRGANKQKHLFKKDPKAPIWGAPPKVVGGKLLASGYWGIARHCNYLGDLLLALSFSLPCGVSSAVPYFYPTYLLILLIWRERRDEARCSEKYKEIWAEYCKLVPWRILPYVY